MILEFPDKIKNKLTFLVKTNKFVKTNYECFDDVIIEFLSTISNIILKDKKFKNYPDLISYAFWCRGKILIKKKISLQLKNSFGRGLTFHIAPSNVALNFLYSFSFSLLAGNSNIVRLPSKKFKEIDVLFQILKKINFKKFKKIFDSNVFIRYEQDDSINEFFSSISDTRMIWGGDNTINKFKEYKSNPFCLDINFPDRYSLSIINSKKLELLKNNEFNNLIKNFYNDTYLFDQMACNSPHLIIWENPIDKQIDKFWSKLKILVKQKYKFDNFMSINKLTRLQIDKIKNFNIKKIENNDNSLIRINLKKIDKKFINYKGSFGYFYEIKNFSIKELFKITDKKVQTITYFGYKQKDFEKSLKDYLPIGIDRIVPIGQSFKMNFIWDGYDMINSLSRKIEIK